MPADRFFIDAPLTTPLILEGPELHHLHVMRIRPGETIEVVNGRGELVQAVVESIDKQTAELKITSHSKQPTPQHNLILAQALPRLTSLEWIVEKGTELGVTQFWLFPGERSEKISLSPTQLQRLETIILNSLKQCGRLYLPQLLLKPSLDKWEKPHGTLFFGDVGKAPKLQGPFSDTVFFIGPEKGFAPKEIERLHQFNAKGISLHENILRTETAAITALSQFYVEA